MHRSKREIHEYRNELRKILYFTKGVDIQESRRMTIEEMKKLLKRVFN